MMITRLNWDFISMTQKFKTFMVIKSHEFCESTVIDELVPEN